MDARDDPKYLQLYQDYAKAIQAFENATKDRRRVRNQLAVKRSPVIKALREWGRRPVGSRPTTRIPRGRPAPPRAPGGSAARIRQIYLGDILGWAKIVLTPTVVSKLDPGDRVDVDKLYDQTSRRLYWNAKAHYEKCKRAFFDYVRHQNIDLHKERAKGALAHGANLQMLGVDESDEPGFMKKAREEVEAVCRNVWALYQSSGAKKSTEMKELLLESVADAQYVGLESPTVKMMTTEMTRLVNSGDIKK